MVEKKYRRKQYIINPGFQLKVSGIIALTLLLATFITAIFLYINILNSVLPEFSAKKLEQRMKLVNQLREQELIQYQKEIKDKKLLDFLFPRASEILADYEKGIVVKILHEVNKNFIPWILILITLVLFASIFLTHRIAGPIYNFKKSLSEMQGGNLAKRIHIRWSDEFKDLAYEINQCISTIDESTSEYKTLAQKIKELNEDLGESLKKPTPDANKIEKILSETKNSLKDLEQRLNYYKTSEELS